METDLQVISCVIADEEYAIDISYVQEIIRPRVVTRVPKVASYIDGVINLRGMVIPVLNLRKRFGLPDKPADDTTRVVVLNWQDVLVGILVDSASEVIRLPREAVEQPPMAPGASEMNREYFTGIGKLGHRLLIMLDLARVFNIGDDYI